jgi:dTDP-4-dehydrorhamnose 3,5-epimerase
VRFLETELKGIILIEPDVFQDARGYFLETYHAKKYAQGGIPGPFVQDNLSRSVRGTLRGLHYQLRNAQGKLVMVSEGTVFDVAVDIRKGSPTFGKWLGVELSSENKRQLYIPPGFAHGFCVLSETASFYYKCTDFYSSQDERGIIWNDRTIGISWPVTQPLLSPKDQAYKSLTDMAAELPSYGDELFG